MPKDDKLIAATLKEAEKHREHFLTIVQDNENISADLKVQKADLDTRQNATEAREAQQANTATEQLAKNHDLDVREADLRKATAVLASERTTFGEESATLRKTQRERQAELDEQERNLSARETTLTKSREAFEEQSAKRQAELDEQAATLRTRQERLNQDAAELAEREKTYEAEIRNRVKEELLAKVGR